MTKLLRDMPRDEREQAVRSAVNIIRQDYFADVCGVAEDVLEAVKDKHAEGLTGEELREALLVSMHETIDGTQRVIYTFQAQLGLISSDNAGAYIEDFGSEGAVSGGDLNWSGMMYAAMEHDVYEALESMGLDVNDPDAFFSDESDEQATSS